MDSNFGGTGDTGQCWEMGAGANIHVAAKATHDTGERYGRISRKSKFQFSPTMKRRFIRRNRFTASLLMNVWKLTDETESMKLSHKDPIEI